MIAENGGIVVSGIPLFPYWFFPSNYYVNLKFSELGDTVALIYVFIRNVLQNLFAYSGYKTQDNLPDLLWLKWTWLY